MIVDTFKTGIWKCDASAHLNDARSWFVDRDSFVTRNASDNFLTTLNGYNSASTNTFPTGKGVDEFKDLILYNSYMYLYECGYNTENLQMEVKRIWLNEMFDGSSHPTHTHYGNILSGCFYVDLPDGSSNISFEGPLSRIDKVYLENRKYTSYNSITWKFEPQEGELFMWESYLRHGVTFAKFDGVRRSVAFDVSWV